ncbi:MAG TPA: alpha/beta hydrolase [Thermoleophilaceae bacterium]|nr:alpha/beta hydrolase [Thermoleophilaceae bacterium]
MVSVSTGDFVHDGHRLVYYDYGSGSRPFLLLPGLLLPQTMHRPLAQALAERGNRVITLDLLGHGVSDRPRDMWRYSMPLFGEQAVALLDHLEIEEAVVGGTSLGANVTLEAAVLAPDRMRGLVIEMPVLDNALLGCALAFTPLLVSLTFGAPLTRMASRVARRIPRGLNHLTDVGLDWMSQDPAPSAAVLQGLFFGRVAPPRSERSRIETRSLVIGHGRDPVHPFSDSDMLVRELRHGRLIEANSIVELRLAPARLTGEIARFLDECWGRPSKSAADAPERASA